MNFTHTNSTMTPLQRRCIPGEKKITVAASLFLFGIAAYLYFYIQPDTPIKAELQSHASVSKESLHKCSATAPDTMYAFGSEVYDFIGDTELRQYIRFTKDNPLYNINTTNTMTVSSPGIYKYNIKALSSTEFVITESVEETATRGGSCFLVRSDSMSTHICNYNDLFNGTYIVHCPLPECTCRNISIWLQYTNFTAYAGKWQTYPKCTYPKCTYPIQKLLWRQHICSNGTKGSAFSRRENIATDKRNVITWYKMSGKWRATLLNGSAYEDISVTNLCRCVKNIRKLFMIGASHMRYKADVVISSCYIMSEKIPMLHSTLTVGNVQYINLTHILEFRNIWDRHLKKERLDERDVVVIQTGAHDTAQAGSRVTMDALETYLLPALNELHKHSDKYGFRLIVVTTPPVPTYKKPHGYNKIKNNFMIAAFNRRLKLELASKNVQVFDEYSVLLAQQDNHVCGVHYLCRQIDGGVTYFVGQVGVTAASLMFSNAICG